MLPIVPASNGYRPKDGHDERQETMESLQIKHPGNRTNFTEVIIGSLTIWFSYETAIAYRITNPDKYTIEAQCVRENDWGPTTGKHLNYVSTDKASRVSGTEFEANINRHLAAIGWDGLTLAGVQS